MDSILFKRIGGNVGWFIGRDTQLSAYLFSVRATSLKDEATGAAQEPWNVLKLYFEVSF